MDVMSAAYCVPMAPTNRSPVEKKQTLARPYMIGTFLLNDRRASTLSYLQRTTIASMPMEKIKGESKQKYVNCVIRLRLPRDGDVAQRAWSKKKADQPAPTRPNQHPVTARVPHAKTLLR